MNTKFLPSSPSKLYRPVRVSKDRIIEELNTDDAKRLLKEWGVEVSHCGSYIVVYKYAGYDTYANQDLSALQMFLRNLDKKTNIHLRTYEGKYADYVWTHKDIENNMKYSFEKFYGMGKVANRLRELEKKYPDYKCRIVGTYLDSNDFNIKSSEKSTELVLDDMLPNITQALNEHLKERYQDKYYATIEVGKRACDNNSEPYKAIVINYKGGDYLKMIRLTQNKFGDCRFTVAQPLCGERRGDFDLTNYKSEIVKIIYAQ